MIEQPPTRAELVDVLLNCREVSDATRRGVGFALDNARAHGRTYPNVRDCIQGAIDSGAPLGSVCASWGYVRNRDDLGEFHNARQFSTSPNRDDERVGVLQSQESLLCLTAWSLFTGIGIPFSFEFVRRRPPRRPRSASPPTARAPGIARAASAPHDRQ